jgi:hypothetical protein
VRRTNPEQINFPYLRCKFAVLAEELKVSVRGACKPALGLTGPDAAVGVLPRWVRVHRWAWDRIDPRGLCVLPEPGLHGPLGPRVGAKVPGPGCVLSQNVLSHEHPRLLAPPLARKQGAALPLLRHAPSRARGQPHGNSASGRQARSVCPNEHCGRCLRGSAAPVIVVVVVCVCYRCLSYNRHTPHRSAHQPLDALSLERSAM